MAALHINLLGGFEAHLGSGEALPLKGRKTQALVAYLALTPGEPRSREELVGLLWGDRGEQQARSSLRQSLSGLRRALGDAGGTPLIAGRDAVSLDAEAVDVDVAAFERLIDDGTAAALEQAVALYKGDLLDGIGVRDPAFEDWLQGQRRRLQEKACNALANLLDQQAAVDTERAIATARRLLVLDPLRETAHRVLMRLYAGTGERALALKQYQDCRDLLADELGVAPETETEALVEEIRGGAGGPARAEALPLPDKPSIAVLPFVNLSGDREQDYFVDGLTGDIITELARFRSLFVIGSVSAFHYKGQSPKLQDVGRDLGVAYVVEGSVRRAGNRVRITAQLVEAATDRHIWAERYDRELEDIFAVQDDVTNKIVSTLAGHIEEVRHRQAKDKKAEDLAAYDYVLLGEQALREGTRDGIREARERFSKAIDLDPGNVRAHSSLARSYIIEFEVDWTVAPELADEAFGWARKAVDLDELDSRARVNLAIAYQLAKTNFEAAQAQFAKALELNPNDADAYCYRGWCHVFAGQVEQAIACTDRAIRLSPFDNYECYSAQVIAHYLAQRYEDALWALGRIADPGCEVSAFRAACYARLGRDPEARLAMDQFMADSSEAIEDWPGEDPEDWRRYWARVYTFKEPADLDHLLDGFRKAGLPV